MDSRLLATRSREHALGERKVEPSVADAHPPLEQCNLAVASQSERETVSQLHPAVVKQEGSLLRPSARAREARLARQIVLL
jgi:hypothetical protein